MAKINGVQIKSLTPFRDHEGCVVYQGNVYLSGKKLGFWSQDYMGGPATYQFDDRLLDDAVKNYKAGFPKGYRYRDYISAETMLCDLVTLALLEKDFKAYQKKGYVAMTVVTDGFHENTLANTVTTDHEEICKKWAEWIEEAKAEMFKNEQIAVTTYSSLDDFDITVDKNHCVPKPLCRD